MSLKKKVRCFFGILFMCIIVGFSVNTVHGETNILRLYEIKGEYYLKWTDFDSMVKYSLWRSDKYNGKYVCVKTNIRKNKAHIAKTNYQKYYYKIRPYIIKNNKKCYGKFSNMCPGSKCVTVVVFAGQSNMAGRGDNLSIAPTLEVNAGYEFRAISNPTKLFPLKEPFGKYENNPLGLNDVYTNGKSCKTGSMVSMVGKTYFEISGEPMVAVSASKGGTKIKEFEPGSCKYNDMSNRLKTCISYLKSNGYIINHIYMAWHQGEVDSLTPSQEYIDSLKNIVDSMHMNCGVEMCFVSLISPSYKSDAENIISAQKEICENYPYCTLGSTSAQYFMEKGLLKPDKLHYTQLTYNIVGREMGESMANYTNTKK